MTIQKTYQEFIPELKLFALRLVKEYSLIRRITFYAGSVLAGAEYLLVLEIQDNFQSELEMIIQEQCERNCDIQNYKPEEPSPEYWRTRNNFASGWMYLRDNTKILPCRAHL